MQPAQDQPYALFVEMRRPAVWVTAAGYVLFTIVEHLFIFSPLFRTFVEQNQSGLFSEYYSRFAGFDVPGAVTWAFYSDLFPVQQLVAVLVAAVMWRKHKGIALGILVVIFAFLTTATCLLLMFFILVRRGY
ncbi:MAG TPA: hypothetical protein VF914_02115 [Chloroflexia bacterium]|jgi:hypothetical protein